ncbi:virulence RhuM family protein [Flavobacterium subsaxonicum]|uniref:virulence RhuM family protein n=1 Tax=Flavobacterium subsaxonicum TaxID=426226 RepID=UPI0003F7EBEB|nr:virulence RhuM family protein [Flavobacterium subsaxonicum]
MNSPDSMSDFLFYTSNDGKIKINVVIDDKNETVWLTQQRIAELFNVDRSVITKHLSNIYKDLELEKDSTSAIFAHVQKEGNRQVKRNIEFYNLDAILSVGYRVNSYEATQFRKWVNSILKEYLIKGFVLDDDRLKQGKNLFGNDYFNELLEKIREIRASERRFYQKITDIYATSIDYDSKAQITQTFFATVQNKLEFAITNNTAPEIIKLRANSNESNMGLTSWKNEKTGGKILKSDVTVAKNYLNQDEISELNMIVSMYLDYAENQAKKKKLMNMKDWITRLDAFLLFNDYEILENSGKIKSAIAKTFAEQEYEKFRKIQDKEYKSDFDKVIEDIKTNGNLPPEATTTSFNPMSIKSVSKLSKFNEHLKKTLDQNSDENKTRE